MTTKSDHTTDKSDCRTAKPDGETGFFNTVSMKWIGWSVHVFTASGVVLALFALVAAAARDFTLMFAFLGLSLVVDGLDGPMARHWKVKEWLPQWDGAILDFVIDYLTYVFIPAFAIFWSGIFDIAWGSVLAIVIALAGAFYFMNSNMKTSDNYFLGFPGVWSPVVFFIFIFKPPLLVVIFIVFSLVAASFAPIKFVHPVRVKFMRPLNLTITAIGAIAAIIALYYNLVPPYWVKIILLITGIYGLVIAGLHQLLQILNKNRQQKPDNHKKS